MNHTPITLSMHSISEFFFCFFLIVFFPICLLLLAIPFIDRSPNDDDDDYDDIDSMVAEKIDQMVLI